MTYREFSKGKVKAIKKLINSPNRNAIVFQVMILFANQ